MNNLYFDPKDKVYYFSGLNQVCDACNEIITDTIIIRVFWDKLGSGVNYLCVKCKDKLKMSASASYTDTYTGIIEENIPPKCIPVAFIKPQLSVMRDISTFDAALKNLEGERVIDKTVYSGRVDPKVPEFVITEVEYKVLLNTALDNFLTSVKNSQPIIEYDDKKVLE